MSNKYHKKRIRGLATSFPANLLYSLGVGLLLGWIFPPSAGHKLGFTEKAKENLLSPMRNDASAQKLNQTSSLVDRTLRDSCRSDEEMLQIVREWRATQRHLLQQGKWRDVLRAASMLPKFFVNGQNYSLSAEALELGLKSGDFEWLDEIRRDPRISGFYGDALYELPAAAPGYVTNYLKKWEPEAGQYANQSYAEAFFNDLHRSFKSYTNDEIDQALEKCPNSHLSNCMGIAAAMGSNDLGRAVGWASQESDPTTKDAILSAAFTAAAQTDTGDFWKHLDQTGSERLQSQTLETWIRHKQKSSGSNSTALLDQIPSESLKIKAKEFLK
jgi:hypothetical protein